MSNNLAIWEKVRVVPKEAQKPIKGGRLSGMTDINPVWRMKALTEAFGMVGVGWYYEIKDQWLESGAESQMVAFCNIELFVKVDGEWSKPIPGTGGSMLLSKEKSGLHTNDEAYKMALTDAISVSCKALGVGADIYWEKDRGKYDKPEESNGSDETTETTETKKTGISEAQIKRLYAIAKSKGIDAETVKGHVKTKFNKGVSEMTKAEYDKVCSGYEGMEKK